jgi:hypothetical protein
MDFEPQNLYFHNKGNTMQDTDSLNFDFESKNSNLTTNFQFRKLSEVDTSRKNNLANFNAKKGRGTEIGKEDPVFFPETFSEDELLGYSNTNGLSTGGDKLSGRAKNNQPRIKELEDTDQNTCPGKENLKDQGVIKTDELKAQFQALQNENLHPSYTRRNGESHMTNNMSEISSIDLGDCKSLLQKYRFTNH